MAKNKLTLEQRETLLAWLAADYDGRLIQKWFDERKWPQITKATVSHYRKQYAIDIDRIRKERRDTALSSGLALKAERVKRLIENADALEAIKWEPGENGRLYNEKAWRETLADIAAELGHRKQVHEVEASEELRKALAKLGLTLNDIASDPLAVSLFAHAGVSVSVGDEATRDNSGTEAEEKPTTE
jgi:hypothetical protein